MEVFLAIMTGLASDQQNLIEFHKPIIDNEQN